MDTAILGVIIDSSTLIGAERRQLTAAEALAEILHAVGTYPAGLSAVSIAELAHGMHTASDAGIRQWRRMFLDALKSFITV